MRFHLDSTQRESRFCLAFVIALMVLTGSAILVMGAHYNFHDKAINRVALTTPF